MSIWKTINSVFFSWQVFTKNESEISFPSEENKDRFLKQLLEDDIINEAILLSTCNRVEIITAVSYTETAAKSIIKKLSKYSGIDFDDLYEF